MTYENDNITSLPVARNQQNNDVAIYDPYANERVPEEEVDLRELWRIIVKYKGTIFTILIFALVTTTAATLLMRPVYRAQATIEIKPESGNIVKFQNLEKDNYEPLEYKTTQQNILQSNSVAEAVIDRLSLQDNLELSGKITQRGFITGASKLVSAIKNIVVPRDEVSDGESEIGSAADLQHAQLLRRFKERLSVTPIRRSDLFKVSFDSFDPDLSSEIANTVVEEYMRLNQERRFGSTSGAKEFLQQEISRVQARLESSEKDLTEFARENQIVDVEDKDDIMTNRLRDLNAQLTVVNGERFAAESKFVQSKSSAGIDALPDVLQDELIQNLKRQYAELQGEYFNLSKIYKPAYPKLVQIEAEMTRIKSTLDLETRKIVDGIKSIFEQLTKKEALLQESLEAQKTNLLTLQDRSVQYNILKREWETNKQLYTGLLERMKEVGVAAGMEINNISLIDRAKAPISHFKPNLKVNTVMAGVLGLLLGISLAFLLAYLDNTVRSPEELEKVTGISSLGIVPKLGSNKKSRRRSRLEHSELAENLEMISHLEKENEVSEAFRSIRTSLMFSSPEGVPRVIQVTSSCPGEGKTTVATNLATVFASNGGKVLLVDADLRKPRLHKVFKMPSIPGLSEYLTDQTERLPIRKSSIEGLSLISCGTIPPNPAELLGSPAMDKFIDQVSRLFDHVIIDSAPLLGLADSVIISTKVQGVVYTVLTGEIDRNGLREGVKRLRRVRAHLLGAILNKMDMNSSEYGYYGETYYGYSVPENERENYLSANNTG